MKSTSIDVSGKLPHGLVELYACIDGAAKQVDAPFLIVGAMARDLVMVHGFGAKLERGTRDVDFAVDVATWEAFSRLSAVLVELGFKSDTAQPHKLHFVDSESSPWEIDMVPFGQLADPEHAIHWPPDQAFTMSVLGFDEARQHALRVCISNNLRIEVPVASPAGIALLKLIAWLDREPDRRAKDAVDLDYLMRTYVAIPAVENAVFETGIMEACDWDQDLASAMQLGCDAGAIASSESRKLIERELFAAPESKSRILRDMNLGQGLMKAEQMLEAFINGFRSGAA